MRYFNTTGPVDCRKHYCLPPLERLELPEVMRLIEQERDLLVLWPASEGQVQRAVIELKRKRI